MNTSTQWTRSDEQEQNDDKDSKGCYSSLGHMAHVGCMGTTRGSERTLMPVIIGRNPEEKWNDDQIMGITLKAGVFEIDHYKALSPWMRVKIDSWLAVNGVPDNRVRSITRIAGDLFASVVVKDANDRFVRSAIHHDEFEVESRILREPESFDMLKEKQ